MSIELQPLKGSLGGLGWANWEFVRHDWWISSHGRFNCSPRGPEKNLVGEEGEEQGEIFTLKKNKNLKSGQGEFTTANFASFVKGDIPKSNPSIAACGRGGFIRLELRRLASVLNIRG